MTERLGKEFPQAIEQSKGGGEGAGLAMLEVGAYPLLWEGNGSSEPVSKRGSHGGVITMEELLAHVEGSSTDLTRIIEAALREDWPCVVVSSQAVDAWERRAPGAWPTVRSWLDSQGKPVVIV